MAIGAVITLIGRNRCYAALCDSTVLHFFLKIARLVTRDTGHLDRVVYKHDRRSTLVDCHYMDVCMIRTVSMSVTAGYE